MCCTCRMRALYYEMYLRSTLYFQVCCMRCMRALDGMFARTICSRVVYVRTDFQVYCMRCMRALYAQSVLDERD